MREFLFREVDEGGVVKHSETKKMCRIFLFSYFLLILFAYKGKAFLYYTLCIISCFLLIFALKL